MALLVRILVKFDRAHTTKLKDLDKRVVLVEPACLIESTVSHPMVRVT